MWKQIQSQTEEAGIFNVYCLLNVAEVGSGGQVKILVLSWALWVEQVVMEQKDGHAGRSCGGVKLGSVIVADAQWTTTLAKYNRV